LSGPANGQPVPGAAKIKRADRRPQGWDLDMHLIRDDLDEEDLAAMERQFPGLTARVMAVRTANAQVADAAGVLPAAVLARLGLPALAALVLLGVLVLAVICWIIGNGDRSDRVTRMMLATKGKASCLAPRPAIPAVPAPATSPTCPAMKERIVYCFVRADAAFSGSCSSAKAAKAGIGKSVHPHGLQHTPTPPSPHPCSC
jgi:hypothetical protein